MRKVCDGIPKICERKNKIRNSDGTFKQIISLKCNI